MTQNGDRFEAAYNEIDAFLRKQYRLDRSLRFSEVVRRAAESSATVRAYQTELLDYGRLRNAIVHDRGISPVLIADPRDDVVFQIEAIWRQLSQPRTLRSLAPPVPLRFFKIDELLSKALSYMRENVFSQVIVRHNARYVILSTEGISHWLEEKATAQVIALSNTQLMEVAACEPSDTCRYLKADDSVDLAKEIFAKDKGKRVFSALVTESGSDREKPITIVTPWDFVVGNLG